MSITASSRWDGWIQPDHSSNDPFAVPIYGVEPFVRVRLRPAGWSPDQGEMPRPGLNGKPPVEVPKGCPHKGRVPKGSVCYCEECAGYGREDDKRLIRDPRDDPKPEPAAVVEAEPEPTRAEKHGRKTSGKMARRNARKRAETGEAA